MTRTIPLDVLDHILPFYFSQPLLSSDGNLKPPTRPTSTSLLLVSSAFRQASLPHIFRAVVIRDLALFFDPENGLFHDKEEGARRWAWVKELWIPDDMTPPLRAASSDLADAHLSRLIPLVLPQLSPSQPKPRMYIFDNSTAIALEHTAFLIRARALCPTTPLPLDAPPTLAIGSPANERYLNIIRSATADVHHFLVSLLRSANPFQLHVSSASFTQFFLHRRHRLPPLSFTEIRTVRIYFPIFILHEEALRDFRRCRAVFPTALIEFAMDPKLALAASEVDELKLARREGTLRFGSWGGKELDALAG